MNQFLRNLTAEQQVSALFIIVFGLLFLTSATVFMLLLRERGDDALRPAWLRSGRPVE